MSAEAQITNHPTQDTTHTRLPARWRTPVRAVWLVVVLATVALYITAIPLRLNELRELCVSPPCPPSQVTAAGAEAQAALGISAGLYATVVLVGELTLALTFIPSALILFWRRSDDWLTLFVSLTLVLFGSSILPTIHAAGPLHTAIAGALLAMQGLGAGLAPVILYVFPNGRFVPRWTRWLAVVWIITILFVMPLLRFTAFGAVIFGSVLGSGFVAQIYRYRQVSTATERQQTKWVIFGFALFVLGAVNTFALVAIFPKTFHAYEIAPSSSGDIFYRMLIMPMMGFLPFALLPFFFAISILRYRLWDIDLIIRRTLIYGLVMTVLGAIYVGSITLLQSVLVQVMGSTSPLVLVASTLATVALFAPMRRRVQEFVDRRFYRQKYDIQQTLDHFGETIQQEVDIETLEVELLRIVEKSMHPRNMSIWLKREE